MIAELGYVLPCQWSETKTRLPMDAPAPTTAPDAHLLKLFEQMLDQYQDKVFRLACAMLSNETAAQDIAQEVFMKIWKALPSYRAGASPSSWIYTITRNTCLTELKRRRSGQNLSLAEETVQAELDRQTAAEPTDISAGAEMDVQSLLAELPENYRQVLVLFYLEQKSYEEVAAMLAVPMGTVKTHLHRAKKELMRLTAQRKESYA